MNTNQGANDIYESN